MNFPYSTSLFQLSTAFITISNILVYYSVLFADSCFSDKQCWHSEPFSIYVTPHPKHNYGESNKPRERQQRQCPATACPADANPGPSQKPAKKTEIWPFRLRRDGANLLREQHGIHTTTGRIPPSADLPTHRPPAFPDNPASITATGHQTVLLIPEHRSVWMAEPQGASQPQRDLHPRGDPASWRLQSDRGAGWVRDGVRGVLWRVWTEQERRDKWCVSPDEPSALRLSLRGQDLWSQ